MARIADCVRLAGSAPAGVLLYRILWWDARPKVMRGQAFWIVNAREKWVEDTGLTPDQVKHAMAELQKRGLIVVERHLFKSKIHGFVRLGSGVSAQSIGQNDANGSGEYGPIYKKGGLEGSSGKETGVLTDAGAAPEPEQANLAGEKHVKGLKSVKDLQAVKEKTLLKPDKTASLELLWKQRVSEITGAFIALSVKERGMLTNFRKLCPPGKALEVMEVVLADWPFYAKRVKAAAGLAHVPMNPSIAFLLKHRAEAIALWTAAEKAKNQAPVAAKAACHAPPVQVTSPQAASEEEDAGEGLGFADLWFDPNEEA
jgi:hypothetical protein